MITYDMIREAQDFLLENWGEDGKRVIEAASRIIPYNDSLDAYLSKECYCCGGNWGGMFLTGIQKLYPEVWDAIPEHMGALAFPCICYTLILCGVDTSKGED